jgi:hypothetical protein
MIEETAMPFPYPKIEETAMPFPYPKIEETAIPFPYFSIITVSIEGLASISYFLSVFLRAVS